MNHYSTLVQASCRHVDASSPCDTNAPCSGQSYTNFVQHAVHSHDVLHRCTFANTQDMVVQFLFFMRWAFESCGSAN